MRQNGFKYRYIVDGANGRRYETNTSWRYEPTYIFGEVVIFEIRSYFLPFFYKQ